MNIRISIPAAGKLALHLSGFIVAITGVAVAVGSAFPIFGRGVPWAAARLERVWPERPPEPPGFVVRLVLKPPDALIHR